MRRVRNVSTRHKGVGVVQKCVTEMRGGQRVQRCIRRELAQDGARGFGFGIGCSEVILMTWDGCRQVGIGQIGVGTVTVMTACWKEGNDTN